jgi:peptide chain release factor 1
MKELLFSVTKKDFDIQYYKSSGAGGQNRNKRETAVRLIHKDSGIMVTCADEREQNRNLKKAFHNLINNPEFKKWLKIRAAKAMQNEIDVRKQIEKEVENWTQDKFLKIETTQD